MVVPGPWAEEVCFWVDIRTGEAYRVDTESGILTEEDLWWYEAEVIAADRKEVANFMHFKAFKCCRVSDARKRPLSCVWVRRWKRMPDGTFEIKSRLCVRGFLGPRRHQLSRHSSTATRLSEKLVVSNSVNNDFELESWDIGAAFLQGASFENMKNMCKELGIPTPDLNREVWITVPENVWFYLRELGI